MDDIVDEYELENNGSKDKILFDRYNLKPLVGVIPNIKRKITKAS